MREIRFFSFADSAITSKLTSVLSFHTFPNFFAPIFCCKYSADIVRKAEGTLIPQHNHTSNSLSALTGRGRRARWRGGQEGKEGGGEGERRRRKGEDEGGGDIRGGKANGKEKKSAN